MSDKYQTYEATEEQLEFLDDLRESGTTNMFGATPYLRDEFDLTNSQAKAVLRQWMMSFEDRQKQRRTA